MLYFTASLVLLGSVADDAPLWFLLFLLLNFMNAARLVHKVPEWRDKKGDTV
jgi:hypothetical protein